MEGGVGGVGSEIHNVSYPLPHNAYVLHVLCLHPPKSKVRASGMFRIADINKSEQTVTSQRPDLRNG